MKIIDAHCHLDPESDRLNAETRPYIQENRITYTESGLLAEMKKSGVDHSLVISLTWKRNEFTRKLALRHPKKISAIATLYGLSNANTAQKYLERQLEDKTFRGIKFYLGYEKLDPLDKKWKKIYDLAEKYDLPVIFHTGDTLGSKALIKLSHPILLDELAVRYPRLKIVIAHFGNPWVLDAAEVVYKNPNVYADLSGLIIGKQKPDKYLIDRLRGALAYCGWKKLMFGTDYPLVKLDAYLEFINMLGVPRKEHSNVFGKTAAKLFQLSV